MSSLAMDWNAEWIWARGPESPRNEWRCFRRNFIAGENAEGASIRITADSRYVLYVNGERVGRGPVRSWPFELAYDEYEVGHLLRAGEENVIAVLVMHYGISTFQYLRGRGGVLVELRLPGEPSPAIKTDGTWRTALHEGYDRRSPRISCQLAFTEVHDARKGDDRWVRPGFDDTGWEAAQVIGPAGMEPWSRLVPRDIPYLTEEIVYPARVEELSAVVPVPWSAVLDLRTIMVPDSVNHANPVDFCGYLAAAIRLEEPGELTIGIFDGGRGPGIVSVDGRWLPEETFTGEHPERFATVTLAPGEHLLLLDVTGGSHGHGFRLGLDCSTAFEIRSPLPGSKSGAPFAAVGPFDYVERIDHEPYRALKRDHPEYLQIRGAASVKELLRYRNRMREVDRELFTVNDAFTACLWKKDEPPYPVPHALQHAVTDEPGPALLPLYPGKDTEIVIDFGRELSGYITFELDAADGTVVDGYGLEFMQDGWRQHTYLVDNTFRYICREGRQAYTSLVRRGLRYLILTFRRTSHPVKLYGVSLLQSNYPVAQIGGFRSSDPLLDEIWRISRDTTRLCMEDTFVDCPAYEQAFWVGDARNEALVNYYAFGALEIVERCLKLVPGSSFQTPLYADQVPSGWNSVIPNWTFFWVTACLEYFRYGGKTAFPGEIWPHVRSTLHQYLALLNGRGLLDREGWNLLDWAPFEQPRKGVVAPQNMFFVKALRDAAEIGRISGAYAEAEAFAEAAEQLKRAINVALWDEETAAFVDCIHPDGRLSATRSVQTQIVACLCGIADGERRERIERLIIDPPASFVPAGSPFMSFFLYEALAQIGRFDRMVADMRRNYGLMIEHGATTCWEMYPWSDFNANPRLLTRSHCHAWSAGPAYFLGAHVLGVQGTTPGWTEVRIAPQPCGLTWAKGSVPLPGKGRIDVAWRLQTTDRGREIHLHIKVPGGVKIVTKAPDGYLLDTNMEVY